MRWMPEDPKDRQRFYASIRRLGEIVGISCGLLGCLAINPYTGTLFIIGYICWFYNMCMRSGKQETYRVWGFCNELGQEPKEKEETGIEYYTRCESELKQREKITNE